MKVWRLALWNDCELASSELIWEKFFLTSEKAVEYANANANEEIPDKTLNFLVIETDAVEAFSAFWFGSCYYLECFQIEE